MNRWKNRWKHPIAVLALAAGTLAACSSDRCCPSPCAPRPTCASPCSPYGPRGYAPAPVYGAPYAGTMPYTPPPAQPGAGTPGAPGAPGSPATVQPQTGDAVVVQHNAYVPATLTVRVGTTVRWTNRDAVPHSATGEGFDVELPPGGEGSHTFATPGAFDVQCRYHQEMRGRVIVQ